MIVKLLELRDKATFIPIFAFKPHSSAGTERYLLERYLLERAGFGPQTHCVIVGRLECAGVSRNCTYDPFSWNDRTFTTAHRYIQDNFDDLVDGQVIDVEFILSESAAPKRSEAFA